mmetsp:Transcript_5604/g.12412  ORF Transcript_5604/g.12412 Transcript_5604/m.12412 type:complete len:724 (+) Transcript_5604:271-2442(+)
MEPNDHGGGEGPADEQRQASSHLEPAPAVQQRQQQHYQVPSSSAVTGSGTAAGVPRHASGYYQCAVSAAMAPWEASGHGPGYMMYPAYTGPVSVAGPAQAVPGAMYYGPAYYGHMPGPSGHYIPAAYPGWAPYGYPLAMMVAPAALPYPSPYSYHAGPSSGHAYWPQQEASLSAQRAGPSWRSNAKYGGARQRQSGSHTARQAAPRGAPYGSGNGASSTLSPAAADASSDCGSDTSELDDEDFSPNYPISPDASSWGSLTVGILQSIMSKLGDGEVKNLRLVCQHWRAVVDHNLESLTPNSMKPKLIVTRFPNLKVLHLTNCANVRNRDLLVLSRSGLRLHTLTLGDDANKPWVTNRGLSCIAQITTLTSLNLQDCNSITNNGLLALEKLKCLSSLSLKGCRKLTNCGLEALQRNTALTSLNLYGCLRVADKGLLPLTGLQLVSLHLGNTRIKDEGLAYLAQITSLQELHFDQEEITDSGIKQLSSLTQLQSLALRDCVDVSGDSLSELIPSLPNLQSLDLYKNFTIDDSQLAKCLEFLGSVTFLDLRGTYVTEDGLQQLTKLSSLQKLCLAPTKDDLWTQYLCVVSNLTQLTSLTINNCTLIQFPLLETLRQLKLLRELDLSDNVHKEEEEVVGKESVNPTAINAMATITSLTSIDLSRRPVHEEHLNVLAERLPKLHTLIIVGCPVLYTEVQALQRRFPELIIHRKPLFDISCSSSDHGSG